MHLAIAKRYLEKGGKVDNQRDFFDASILPDIAMDKVKSHYRKNDDKVCMINRANGKVDLDKFLRTHILDNDLNRGVYLHLYADSCYYKNLPVEYLKNATAEDFLRDNFYTFSFYEDFVAKKYNVSLDLTIYKRAIEIIMKEKKDFKKDAKLLLTESEIIDFIETVSSIKI